MYFTLFFLSWAGQNVTAVRRGLSSYIEWPTSITFHMGKPPSHFTAGELVRSPLGPSGTRRHRLVAIGGDGGSFPFLAEDEAGAKYMPGSRICLKQTVI